MRVLLISHTCQSLREGQPKARFLSKLPGIELMVVSPERFRVYDKYTFAERPTGVAYRYEATKIRWPWAGPANCYLHHLPALRQLMRSFQPDVIDLWEEPWSLVSAQTVWLRDRFMPHVPIVSETEQNMDRKLPPPFEWLRRYVLRRAQFVVGRNAEAIALVRSRGYRGPAAVMSNAVDETLFRPLDRTACRDALGLSGFVVGYVGRLVDFKGVLDLVKAIRGLPQNMNLALVGDGEAKAAIEALAEREGLSNRIRLLGKLPLAELPAVMNAFDVLALPSRSTARWKEQFGRVVIEAHACRIPVIGSTSGAIPDVIGPGGLTFGEGDIAGITAAIHTLHQSPQQAAAYAAAGYERVQRLFTWQAVADRMAKIYKSVCSVDTANVNASAETGHLPTPDIYDMSYAPEAGLRAAIKFQ